MDEKAGYVMTINELMKFYHRVKSIYDASMDACKLPWRATTVASGNTEALELSELDIGEFPYDAHFAGLYCEDDYKRYSVGKPTRKFIRYRIARGRDGNNI